ncbi:MAG: hypothetical protein WAU01_03315 [Saprospiraceae bacterium]
MQKAFNQDWEGVKPKKGVGFKVFKRWENFMEPRVYPSGDLTLPTTSYGNYLEWQKNNVRQISGARSIAQGSVANWTEIGPLSKPSGFDSGVGRIDFVRFHPTDPNILYVCSPDGGLWKSVNGGTNWTTNTDFLTIIGCSDLVIDPTNPQIMYLATGNREFDRSSIGIFKSTNGGISWSPTAVVFPPSNGITIRRLIMDPTNPQIMIAALNTGIMRTNDGWATFTEPTLSAQTILDDVEFKPGDPNTVYSIGKSFYKSTDKGVTWSHITSMLPDPTDLTRGLIAVTAANPDYVYAVYGNVAGGYLGTFRSTNSATSFTQMSSMASLGNNNILNCDTLTTNIQGQASHNLAIVVSPTDAQLVTIGGCNIWQSTDGGTTWKLSAYWLGNDTNYPGSGVAHPDYVHADIQSLDYLPGSNSVLFATCDGGISKSTNNGANWTDISHDLRVSQMTNVGQSSLTPYNMITGLQDIGTLKNTNGNWYVTNGGDGEDGFIDRTNDNNIITSNPNGAFALSNDGGVTRFDITGLPAGVEFLSPIHQDPTNASLVYAGGRPELYSSSVALSNPMATWTMLGAPAGGGSGGIIRFEIAPSNNQIIYAIKANNLSKSINAGMTFTEITGSLPVGDAQLTNLCIANTDPDKVWVTFSGYAAGVKVFKTTNGGTSWTNISTGLPNLPMNTIVYTKDSPKDAIYLGADIGVYYMDNTTPWTSFFTGLPNNHVNDLEIYYPTSKIRAATYGRGLWESDLYVACDKPMAGVDQTPTCTGNNPITTATLAATPVSGGAWTQVAGNPAGAMISNPSSATSGVTGLNPGVYDFIWSIASDCGDTVKITIPDCSSAPCTISLTAVPGTCVPATNHYTLTGVLTFANMPTTGTLTVSVSGGGTQVFNAPFTSTQNYSIAGLTSDGASHTVTAVFSATPACTNTANYTAPADCSIPPCTISVNCASTPNTNCTSPNGNVSVSTIAINPTYLWSNAATTSSITGISGGIYTVTVTEPSTGCTGVCQATVNNPMNCCDITVSALTFECLDNGTPTLITDNRLRVEIIATNAVGTLTTYNLAVQGNTSIVTPNSGMYGTPTLFTLGTGSAGGGATFTLILTDVVTGASCSKMIALTDPMNCGPATPDCLTPKFGTATIQVSGN